MLVQLDPPSVSKFYIKYPFLTLCGWTKIERLSTSVPLSKAIAQNTAQLSQASVTRWIMPVYSLAGAARTLSLAYIFPERGSHYQDGGREL